ncbi:MAG TPA: ABC transporter permease [Candidatus Dormibacteraeota bacterium]|nr:ABC transporter permease [Candidatus Dormibacteraeota bacterium]
MSNVPQLSILGLQLAFRSLRRHPGFTLCSLAILIVVIAAITSLGGAAYELLGGPLPFGRPNQLATIWSDLPKSGYPRAPLSSPELFDLRARSKTFKQISALTVGSRTLGLKQDPIQIGVGLVTAEFFETLDVKPYLGRTFRQDDEGEGKPPTVILSWALWKDRFGGNAAVLGTQVPIEGAEREIVGVMPASFRMAFAPDANIPEDTSAWMPFPYDLRGENRTRYFLRVIGRLRDGVTAGTASGEIAAIGASLEKEFSVYASSGRRFFVVGLNDDLAAPVKVASWSLLTAGVFLLLLGFANLSGLWIARAIGQRKNHAISQAIGASVADLRNEVLLQAVMIATVGCAGGVLVGWAGLAILRYLRPLSLARIDHAAISEPILLIVLGIAITGTLLLAIVTRTAISPLGISEISGTRVDAAPRYRLRAALIVGQVSLTLLLLVYAGLSTRAFQNVLRTDVGFRPEKAFTFRYSLNPIQNDNDAALDLINRRLDETISSIPGVQSAGTISYIPFDHLPNWSLPYRAVEVKPGSEREADFRTVSPSVLQALGIRLLAGRFFQESDSLHSPRVAVVDHLLAERTWPGADPVNRQISLSIWPGDAEQTYTVIGVISHVRNKQIELQAREQLYLSVRQLPYGPYAYVVRGSFDPSVIASVARKRVHDIDSRIPLWDMRPLMHYYDDAIAERRFTALLLAVFAMAALILTSVGIYGLLAYIVSTRRTEFGVRMALGAGRNQIFGSVLGESLVWSLIGASGSVFLSLPLMTRLTATLYGVSSFDMLSWAGAVAFLLSSVVIASMVPSLRAAYSDPAILMRSE